MSDINKCTRITIDGGQDPQTLDISSLISSTGANSSIEVSYCVNGGAAQGVVNTPILPPMPVSNLAYNQTVTGLSAGDYVDVKILADVATMVGDTGSLCFSGDVTQTDADDCSITETIPQSCCDWTAIDGSIAVPDCSVLPSSIKCDDLPYTVPAIPNSTSVTVSITGSDYSYNGTQIIDTTSGSGGMATATVTASNGNPAQDCTATISISECDDGNGGGPCPASGSNTMLINFTADNTPGTTTFGPFGTMSGTGPISFSGIFLSGVQINDIGGGQWEVVIDNDAQSGGPENLIVSQDGIDCDVGTITINNDSQPLN